MAGIPPDETKFKAGVSGNPAGRPLGAKGRAATVRKFLEASLVGKKDPWGASKDDLTIQDMMTIKMITKVMNGQRGDVQAYKELMDAAHGKIPDIIAGDPDNPISNQLTVVFVDAGTGAIETVRGGQVIEGEIIEDNAGN